MGKFESGSLGSFTAIANGTGVDVSHLETVGVSISGTFVATIKIQVSYDGTNWADVPASDSVGPSFTAPGSYRFQIPAKQVRAICSAFTSGTAVVKFGGRDEDNKD